MSASEYLAEAERLVPGIGDHACIPGSAAPPADAGAVWALLERAVSLEPSNAAVHAARGNLLVRRGLTDAAQRSYALAARLDPAHAPARLMLGELAFMAGDEAAAQGWFDAAFALSRRYSAAARAGARSALVLCTRGPWQRNVPLDFVVDPQRWTLHRWYVPDGAGAERGDLPAYDIVIDAIGESLEARPALEAAQEFLATQGGSALNDPRNVSRTARDALSATLRDIAKCGVADVRRMSRSAVLALHPEAPLLVRPTDAHGGRGLERLHDAIAIASYVGRVAAAAYDVGPFVDYRSADGFYRKYRVMFVGGKPYPCHLAIDTEWMIHYHRAPMAENAWMREEERRFLRSPEEALAGWSSTLPAIAAAVGLDYFGIDCTVLPDGTVFVFEADAAMLVHGFDPDPEKRGAYAGICSALGALLEARAG